MSNGIYDNLELVDVCKLIQFSVAVQHLPVLEPVATEPSSAVFCQSAIPLEYNIL